MSRTVRNSAARIERGAAMGAIIMLGTLIGLIVIILGVVYRYDPQARRAPDRERDR